MKIIIIGASEAGKALANALSGAGNKVTLIEQDEEKSKKVANELECLTLKGDATDISILKEAGIEEADAIVACTLDDKTNLMACEIAKSTKVKKIVSVVNVPRNEELFTKLGISLVVSSVGTTVTKIKLLLSESMSERIIASLGGGKVEIIEIVVEKGSAFTNKKPQQIQKGIVAAIYRSGDILIPDKKTLVMEGDVLLVAAKTGDVKSIGKKAKGK